MLAQVKLILRSKRGWLLISAISYLLFLLVLLLLQKVITQQEGIFALTTIFAPYFFLPLLLWLPFLFMKRMQQLWMILFAGLVIFMICYPPQLFPQDVTAEGKEVSVLSWNMKAFNINQIGLDLLLRNHEADIVALQEAQWEEIVENIWLQEHYQYQLLEPSEGMPPGMAILSKFPIMDYGILENEGTSKLWDIPRVSWAKINISPEKALMIVNAHPISGAWTVENCVFCAERRDMQIRALKTFLYPHIRVNEHILVVGDMNTTDREPIYEDLTRGLNDAHRSVGTGPGHTWGIARVKHLWAFLRIDYMLNSRSLVPTHIETICSAEARWSDHCALLGRFIVKNEHPSATPAN